MHGLAPGTCPTQVDNEGGLVAVRVTTVRTLLLVEMTSLGRFSHPFTPRMACSPVSMVLWLSAGSDDTVITSIPLMLIVVGGG